MNKQAYLEEVYNSAFNDELEKIAAKTIPQLRAIFNEAASQVGKKRALWSDAYMKGQGPLRREAAKKIKEIRKWEKPKRRIIRKGKERKELREGISDLVKERNKIDRSKGKIHKYLQKDWIPFVSKE